MRLFIIFLLVGTALGERFLFLSPLGSHSHKNFFMSISEALAKRGHYVTMVSPNKPLREIHNIREVVIKGWDMDNTIMTSAFEDSYSPIMTLVKKSPEMCADSLSQQQVQDLKKENIDLILVSMFFADCYLSFVHHFKVPFIFVSPLGMLNHFHDMVYNIDFPSMVPNLLNEAKFPMTFTERALNVFLSIIDTVIDHFFVAPNMENVCRQRGLCPEGMPSFHEIRKNASLAILNSIRTLEIPPRPMMTNIIYAGGAHTKPTKNISKELDEWISGSKDGCILFTLGSILRASRMPEKYRKILFNVFGSLKERVLMKWDEDSVPGLPKNVKIVKWLPQHDVLGHLNIKLFISHGGLLGSMEATYNAVPIVGMPVFSDQFFNTNAAEKEGWAKVMQWKNLEEESFRKLIIDALNDKQLREISKHRSAIMKDVQVPPEENAVYWIEYVLRHKGAPHLTSPVIKMAWYEIYNMDIYALLAGFVLGFIYLFWISLRSALRTFCFEPKMKNKQD